MGEKSTVTLSWPAPSWLKPKGNPLETYITPERAAQLKAEAVAARRAARPAWRNAHADRLAREREARKLAKEYREANRTKVCPGCDQLLPLDAFAVKDRERGTRKARCNPCLATAARAAYRPKERAPRQSPDGEPKQCPGCQKTLPADAFRSATGRKRYSRCQPCRNADKRAAYHRKVGRNGTGAPRGQMSPERQRERAERIAHLATMLQATNPHERLASEEGWEAATSELQRLWAQSGDKECVSCKATVPPSAMLPPGPANFYPGKCRACVREEYLQRHWQVFGRAPDGPRLIPMKDGTAITVAELARRVRDRQAAYRR